LNIVTRARLDLEMARRGLADSRERAQKLIMAGLVRVNSRPVAKPDVKVDSTAEIEIARGAPEYASRGAYKMRAALDHFSVNVTGRLALDVGASTGGFTDVLLRRGAAHVVALDVGYGQLVTRIRNDPRVTILDRTNVRFVEPADLPYRPDLVVIDTSFISLRLVLPAVAGIAARPAQIIALVKPQFEVGRAGVGKGGVVRDDELRNQALERILRFAEEIGFTVAGAIESPLRGPAGNREFFAMMRLGAASNEDR
jgi:23S rRNA (cytidine1920-2'-O)/16S rRNA (cytidine1409-2'-O)-methyltransferase